ncbi:MAG: phosphoglucomutase/phosphomannomutase family protein, partial [Dehalococcoidia bacterium]
TQVLELHSERNPAFPGMSQPEPVAHNLKELSQRVVESGADVGLALDGDADRLGVVDQQGTFITPLQTFALLALYLLEGRGERGPLVKSITSTSMLFRLGELFDVPVHEAPVGFKYIGSVMMQENALMGGEESGGFGFRGHIPERDGILSGLLFLEFMVRSGKGPAELLEELYRRVGPHHYQRRDLSFPPEERQRIQEHLSASSPAELAGVRLQRTDRMDGVRFLLKDGSWVVARFSGTEPLLRLYAEASSPQQVERLLEEVTAILGL